MEGPKGRCSYLGYGDFKITGKPEIVTRKQIGCVAGGTGITPCY